MTRYGRWTVIEASAPSRSRGKRMVCVCDCGTTKVVELRHLKSGRSQSCGCLRDEVLGARALRHGHAKRGETSAEYWAWASMQSRCQLAHHPEFKNYGGRGIAVCDRWRFGEDGLSAFECFFADMGSRPSKDHSIDRIDNDGHYEPGNCRWATRVEQNRNRANNRIVNINGESMPLAAAIERFGCARPTTITARLNKGSRPEAALLTPAFSFSRLPHNRKLSESQVRAIFFDARHHREIAAEHGISSGAVFGIKAGRSWAYLDLKSAMAAKAGGRRQ